MVMRLDSRGQAFDREFRALLDSKRDDGADVSATVAGIIQSVREGGDDALLQLTRQFDGTAAERVQDMAITQEMLEAAAGRIDAATLAALKAAAKRIDDFHKKQIPEDISYTDKQGVQLGLHHHPVDAAGIYVPGGKAAYPSSVLMAAIPARVAGVARRVMMVPAPQGEVSDAVLAAAHIAGVTEAWRIGGAQAIAALAYGTHTIAPVDKIVGPGNAFVSAAKRQVFGQVGIDSIAGPSEVLVLADADSNPEWVALDLLSQAEHDEAAQSILITPDASLADAVEKAVEELIPQSARRQIIAASWRNHGAIILVRNWKEGAALANRIAAEHVEIATAKPMELAARIKHAGAIFLGHHTPEAVGDYVGGPNHVLPTGRTARFSSGLGVADFMKRTTMLGCDAASLKAIGKHAITLAETEGLPMHGLSIARRLN